MHFLYKILLGSIGLDLGPCRCRERSFCSVKVGVLNFRFMNELGWGMGEGEADLHETVGVFLSTLVV